MAPTARTKIRVNVVSRMVRAISFGVFWRATPSTSAIIRSMKVSPGLLVIFTTIRSESTVVPPVTAQRSPPDSRITGADSTSSLPSPSRRRAVVSVRVWRRLCACARPRPSATASARLAKSTVAHSQSVIETENTDGSSTASTVVNTEPTHTTKMTGERNVCRGSSLANACGKASTAVRTRTRLMTGPLRWARERGPGRR